MFFFTFIGCDITFLFLTYQKVLGTKVERRWNAWFQNAHIIETFTKSSWTLDKEDENEFNLIEKYVWAYDPHNRFHTNEVNRLWFILYKKSSGNKMEKLLPAKEALKFQILRSIYAAGWI